MRVSAWKCLLLTGLGLLIQSILVPNLFSQSRDTPQAIRLYEKISPKSDGSREYWVEYKPCTGASHCFVRINDPNEATIDRIKAKEKEENPSSGFLQWKIDGISLDKMGEVDARVLACQDRDLASCEAGQDFD